MGATYRGPLFTGALASNVKRAIEQATEDAGTLGQRYVRDIDDDTFKHPTGIARGMVALQRITANIIRIHRGGLIYQWWLEDGGTRSHWFDGYHAFERATPRLAKDATLLVATYIRRVLR